MPDLVANNDRKSLSSMDIVAVLTAVTKEQQERLSEKDVQMAEQRERVAEEMAEKDAQIAALRDSVANHADRMLQLEMALAEVLRNQSGETQVSLAD